jgi:hypothetical protein
MLRDSEATTRRFVKELCSSKLPHVRVLRLQAAGDLCR